MSNLSLDTILRFSEARGRVLGEECETVGIGGLTEKCLHKVLKYYIEPRIDLHEIKYLGSVADIKNESGVVEIQTRAVERLAKKLEKFLESTPVCIVIPIICEKTVSYIDPETGEITGGRKSPKHENAFTAFRELYKIRTLVNNEYLSFRFIYLRADEYKYLDGWDKTRHKGSTRVERIPTDILDDITFTYRDIVNFLPFDDGEFFSAKELCKRVQVPPRISSYVVGFLKSVGAIELVCKEGRAFIYKKA